jgi:hypothetical protein
MEFDTEGFLKDMRKAGLDIDPIEEEPADEIDDAPPVETGPLNGQYAPCSASNREERAPKEIPPNPHNAAVGRRLDNNTLILPKGAVRIQDSAARLFGILAATKKFFQKGGAVVSAFDAGDFYKPKRQHKKGANANAKGNLRVVGPGELRSDLEKYVVPFAWTKEDKKDVLKQATCSSDHAESLLKTQEVYLLPPMQTTPSAPIAIEGEAGKLEILTKGYHDFNGGTVILNNVPLELPDFETAVKDILHLFREFDFQSPSDKSRAIANLVSPALSMGQFVEGWVPVALAEADQSQAGKGLQHRMTAAIYHEKPHVVTKREGGVGSLDESLSTALLSGKPFIRFDNVRGPLNSQLFESLVTDGEGQARVPHRAEVTVHSNGLFFMMTSNGFQATEDFANRSCIVRIRKRVGCTYEKLPDKPPARTTEVYGLEKHVERNRAYYLGCIFAVLKEWVRQGKPCNEDETRHDSRDWVTKMDWIVRNLFKLPPLMDGHIEAAKRISNPSLNFLRALCLSAEKDGRLGITWKATDFVSLADKHGISIPGHKSDNEEDAKRQVGTQLGLCFKEETTIKIEGFCVTRTVGREKRTDRNEYRDVKTYRIEKAGEAIAGTLL